MECDEYAGAIQQILATRPQTGMFKTLVVLQITGEAWIHRCSLAVGWWSSDAKRKYATRFYVDPPLWTGLVHPVHIAKLCDLASGRDRLLPEDRPFNISEYFRQAGSEKLIAHNHDTEVVQQQGYSSIFQWSS
jgi:hypothetical protein